jgi:hypothetical protein
MQFPSRFSIFAVAAIASLSFVSAAPAKVENLPEKLKREGCYTDPYTGENICEIKVKREGCYTDPDTGDNICTPI